MHGWHGTSDGLGQEGFGWNEESFCLGPKLGGVQTAKAVRETKLGEEVLKEIVQALQGGYIPNA